MSDENLNNNVKKEDQIPVKEIGQLLDEVSTKLPKLITSLMSTLYSAEAGKNMGQAVGNLYKELVDSGIPNEDALQMAKDYIHTLENLTNNFGNNGHGPMNFNVGK